MTEFETDITGYGRKMGRNADGNGSGRKYVYAAWAESPFKTARAR